MFVDIDELFAKSIGFPIGFRLCVNALEYRDQIGVTLVGQTPVALHALRRHRVALPVKVTKELVV
jgi:hypothetical protein